MIPSANGKVSGRRFFHTHAVFCNQGDKSGLPKHHKCVCTEMLSRAKRHSWNALLWCTLRCNHLTRTNLCGLQQPHSLYHWIGIPGVKLSRPRDRQLNIIMLFFQLFSGRVPLFVCLHLWHARHAPLVSSSRTKHLEVLVTLRDCCCFSQHTVAYCHYFMIFILKLQLLEM